MLYVAVNQFLSQCIGLSLLIVVVHCCSDVQAGVLVGSTPLRPVYGRGLDLGRGGPSGHGPRSARFPRLLAAGTLTSYFRTLHLSHSQCFFVGMFML